MRKIVDTTFRPVDERDRQGLIDLIERQTREADEYISAIKARPITAVCRELNILKTPWQQPSACVDNPA